MPGPVLTSGEPLALWAFVSSPKQQQQLREGRPGILLCPSAHSLGDPETGKGLRGCGGFEQGSVYLMENQHGMGCSRGESEELCRTHTVGKHPCALVRLFGGRQQTPPSLWGEGTAKQRGDVRGKSLKLLLKAEPPAREEGLAGELGSFPTASLLSLPC